MYNHATNEHGNFLTIDLNGHNDKMFRQNFTNFLSPKAFGNERVTYF